MNRVTHSGAELNTKQAVAMVFAVLVLPVAAWLLARVLNRDVAYMGGIEVAYEGALLFGLLLQTGIGQVVLGIMGVFVLAFVLFSFATKRYWLLPTTLLAMSILYSIGLFGTLMEVHGGGA